MTAPNKLDGAMTTTDEQERMIPGHCHKCGLPLSDNPHPEAGRPAHYLEVGCPKECIPCLSLSRHQWAKRAWKAENEVKDMLSASKPAVAQGMTNGDFHCPACCQVMKGPTACGACLWEADTCGYRSPAAPAQSGDGVSIPRELAENYLNLTNIPRYRRILEAALAAPPAQTERALTDDARDAARYRWLRDRDGIPLPWLKAESPEDADAAIDAAMTIAQPARGEKA